MKKKQWHKHISIEGGLQENLQEKLFSGKKYIGKFRIGEKEKKIYFLCIFYYYRLFHLEMLWTESETF